MFCCVKMPQSRSALKARMEAAGAEMPAVSDYLLRHKCSSTYSSFVDEFVKWVVGAKPFQRLAATKLLSEFVTVTDEAYALLVCENQEKRYQKMMVEGNTRKLTMEARYTDGGGGKDVPLSGKNRKGRGWSSKGIERFNELCHQIREERAKDPDRHKFEKSFLKRKKDELLAQKKKASRKKEYDDDQIRPLKVFNEMDVEPFPNDADIADSGTDEGSDVDDDDDDDDVDACNGSVMQSGSSGSGAMVDLNGAVRLNADGLPVDANGNPIEATGI